MNTIPVQVLLDAKTRNAIEQLAVQAGKPKEVVLQEVVETGLRSYRTHHDYTAKALLALADYAEKIGAKGPKDLSQNVDAYLWNE